jgi:hypothetical protein
MTRWTGAAAVWMVVLVVAPVAGAAAEERDAGAAGYERGFYVRSADGQDELRLGLVSQIRYLHNHGRGSEAKGADTGGFQLRRTQLDLQGHVMGPRWTFRLRLDSSNGGTMSPAYAWVGYQLTPALDVRVGQLKPSFLAEENVSGAMALAVERSYANDYFTVDFSQGAQLSWRPLARLQLAGSVHSGSYAMRTDFDNDGTAYAWAGRLEYLPAAADPAGAWRLLADYSSWPREPAAVRLGAGADWERGASDGSGHRPDLLKWTVDASAQLRGTGLSVAAMGQALTVRGTRAGGVPGAADGARQLGLTGQLSHFVIPARLEPLARWEWIDFDGVYYRGNLGAVHGDSRDLPDDDQLMMLTAGANCYLRQHRAKLTVDAVYALDAVPGANSGCGLLSLGAGDQWVVRSQLQLSF